MRPVFNDLVTEVQRSIGYFTNIDRKAKIARIVTLGNAMKLPGLQRFLQQNLGLEIDRIEALPRPERLGRGRGADLQGERAGLRRLLRPVRARHAGRARFAPT